MKQNVKKRFAFVVASMLYLAMLPIADPALARQKADSQAAAPDGKQVVAAFEARVKEYVKLREQIEEKMPKLSKESTPEEIEAHKKAFEEAVRAAKVNAKPGDVFTPDIVNHIRAALRREFKGRRLRELRQTILEAETKGVPVRVNYPYPESKELTQIPPTLLLQLPQLPKQVRYRFVSRHMLLVDRETHLIIDYMLDALP